MQIDPVAHKALRIATVLAQSSDSKGRSADDLITRTGIAASDLNPILGQLISAGLISEDPVWGVYRLKAQCDVISVGDILAASGSAAPTQHGDGQVWRRVWPRLLAELDDVSLCEVAGQPAFGQRARVRHIGSSRALH